MEHKLQQSCLTDCNSLVAQDLWISHYQILLIISLKQFIQLNVNINMIIKTAKRVESNTKIAIAFLNTQTLKITY